MATLYDPHNSLASRPPMGWNSYNAFGGMHGLPPDADPDLPGGVALDEGKILQTADAMVRTGMRDAGYLYLNIDDRWQDPRAPRGRDGLLRWDERRFPRGMHTLGDEIHARGLRFGLYTVANVYACGGEEGTGPRRLPATGSLGHEAEDAALFAGWGVDFLKVDWCGADAAGTRGRAPMVFERWNRAIADSGRDMVLAASTWGEEDEHTWAPRLTHMWRTTQDLHPTWASIHAVACATAQPRWARACGPARGWNDPDALQAGQPQLTFDESRTNVVLWAMLAAPLLAGNDLRRADRDIIDLLTSPELIGIDQDRSAPATVQSHDDGWETWTRPLSDGRTAHALVNCSDRGRRPPARLVPDGVPAVDHRSSGRTRVGAHGTLMTTT